MSGFEFAFTLFGLLLGLALTEGLSGLARAIKNRHISQIGWATTLLGLFVACDVVSFWMYGWSLRDKLQVSWPLMFGGFVVTGTYYVCAALVFPSDNEVDFEAHFDRIRGLVLGGAVFCNIALLALTISFVGLSPFGDIRTLVITWTLFPVAAFAMFAKDRRVIVGCLVWLIALYPLSLVWS
ncbi:MAG: hypothetical protein ABL912_08305 [Novosphingobium sp.]